jgi:hypothetical protein
VIDPTPVIAAPRRQQEEAIMPDEVTPERVAAIAAAARVPLEQTSAARVANAVNPTVTRFAAQKIALPLEVEPATYAVVARQGMITK